MNEVILLGRNFNKGSSIVDMTVRLAYEDSGYCVYVLRYVVGDDDTAIPTGREVRFDADRFEDLLEAVETIAWHMDLAHRQGTA